MSFVCEFCRFAMPLTAMYSIECGHLFHSVCLEIICADFNRQCTTCFREIANDPVLLNPRMEQEPIAQPINNNPNDMNNEGPVNEDQLLECENCAAMQTSVENLKAELQESMDFVDDLLEERKRKSEILNN